MITQRASPKKPSPTYGQGAHECTKLLGELIGSLALIGSLIEISGVEPVRKAVSWWAETDEVWEMFRAVTPKILQMAADHVASAIHTKQQ